MTATIKDVAKLAHVSIATVSLVVNHKKNLPEATKTRVFEAVRQLNYYPRRSAKGLPTKKCGNIGFILTEDHFYKTEPFYTKIFIGSELEARKHNNYILLTTVPCDFDTNKDIPMFLLEKNVDGVIMSGWMPDELIDCVIKRNLPHVFVDYLPEKRKGSAILLDNKNGGQLATKYLISLGHKDIGFLGGGLGHPSISERFKGYSSALHAHGIDQKKDLIFTQANSSEEDGYRAAYEIISMRMKPTAIFASNDSLAIGCINRLKEQGLNIPEDISFVGFDDIEASLQIDPHLTTIKVDKEEFGVLAVKRIVSMIEGNNSSNEKIEKVSVRLVKRKSCKRLSNLIN